MKLIAKIILISIVIVSIVYGCTKFETFPIEPAIEYQDFVILVNEESGISERGVIKFTYTDGDGDLGLSSADTLPPFDVDGDYYYNMIIRYFEQQNGEFVEVPLLVFNTETQTYDTSTFNSRFPVLTPNGGNLNIKGLFQDTLYIYNPLTEYDTIKFKVSIYDRALHQSNEIETPPIVIIK
ncbi:MAG: hypothetical protein C0598_10500 [Marinilabiliales bacterium]|nr:MAG: hypothetical protein C0598_10500 [Marinilabiliales bacterium]